MDAVSNLLSLQLEVVLVVNKSGPDLQSDIVADTRDYPEALQRLTMKGLLMAGAIVVILIQRFACRSPN